MKHDVLHDMLVNLKLNLLTAEKIKQQALRFHISQSISIYFRQPR